MTVGFNPGERRHHIAGDLGAAGFKNQNGSSQPAIIAVYGDPSGELQLWEL